MIILIHVRHFGISAVLLFPAIAKVALLAAIVFTFTLKMGCRHENDPPGIIILTDCQPEAIIEESIHAGMTVILRRASVELNKQNHRKKILQTRYC